MAQTIPEKLPGKAPKERNRLFAILKRLPRNVRRYFEPVIDILPGFLVVHHAKVGRTHYRGQRLVFEILIEANPQIDRVWENQKRP